MNNSEVKKHILICDDSEINRVILMDMLEGEFELLEASDGLEAVSLLKQHTTEIDLVLLDIVMPKMDGFEVLAVMNKYHWIEQIPVIMISAETATEYTKRAYELGASDFINRPFDSQIVHRRIMNTIMLYAKQRKLTDMVAEQIYEREKNSNLMVAILSHIVEFRNGESGMHVLHINVLTELLLKRLLEKTDRYGLTKEDIGTIRMASSLHDIGKIAIPYRVLNKPGRLTDEEFAIIKTHTTEGSNLMDKLPFYQEEPLVKFSYQICRWHHERWNGRGYPDGLVGDNIPIAAQVVSIADVYDALTSKRCYKDAFSHEKAMEMIANGECGAFNPLLLECLKDVSEQIAEELEIRSPGHDVQKTSQRVVEELRTFNEDSSAQIMRASDSEHLRMTTLFNESNDLWFTINLEPEYLRLNPAARKRFNLPEVVAGIAQTELLERIEEGRVEHVRNLIRELEIQDPEIDTEFKIFDSEGVGTKYRLKGRAFWKGNGVRCSDLMCHLTEIPE